VSVNSALTILRLNGTPNPAVLGEPVNFSATVTGGSGGYVYRWVFGDGGLGGNLRNITHIFTTSGPFVSTVLVTDSAGQVVNASTNLTIAFNASVSANVSLGAAPLPAQFLSSAVGGVPGYTYAWRFGDGSFSSLPQPAHVYAAPGFYSAQLQVTDAVGHVAGATWAVAVYPGGGTLAMTVSVENSSIVVGESTTLIAQPHGGTGRYSLDWAAIPVGCRPTSQLSFTCAPRANGTYSATAVVFDSGGLNASATGEFTVGQAPNPASPALQPSFWGQPVAYVLLGLALGSVGVLAGSALVERRRSRLAGGESEAEEDRQSADVATVQAQQAGTKKEGSDLLDDVF
jgi:hypothetical protein